VVSARGEPALRAQAGRLRSHLDARPDLDPADVGSSLVAARARLERRAVVVGRDRAALLAGLGALERGEPAAHVVEGAPTSAGKVAFVFPGQGSQWQGMTLGLWESSPQFRERMQACADALAPFVDWSLEDVLRGAPGAPSLDRVDVVQPALFAAMVSLAGLWRSFGVDPDAVVGHSQGEIAAAAVAGALSLEDAARVVALRSRAIAELLAGRGGMVSVGLPADQASERVDGLGGRVSVAALNAPSSVVLAGEPDALDELLAGCERDGVRARRIAVDYASHTEHVDALRERLLEDLAPIRPSAGDIAFYSTATGGLLGGGELDAEYWYRSLRDPVRFEPVTRALVEEGFTAFAETSPHPVLTLAVEEIAHAAGRQVAALGSLRRDEDDGERFVLSLAEAHVRGLDVRWERLLGTRRRVDLPTYAFQRRRFWINTGAGRTDVAAAGLREPEHPLLAAALAVAGEDEWLFTGRLSIETHRWLADHAVLDTVVVPGTGLVELALRAGAQVGCDVLDELTLQAPLVLPGRAPWTSRWRSRSRVTTAAARSRSTPGRTPARRTRSSGRVTRAARSPPRPSRPPRPRRGSGRRPAPSRWTPTCCTTASRTSASSTARRTRASRPSGATATSCSPRCRSRADEAAQAPGFGLHPALFDSILHAALAAGTAAVDEEESRAINLPFAFTGVRLHPAAPPTARARALSRDGGLGRDRRVRRQRRGRALRRVVRDPPARARAGRGPPAPPATRTSTRSGGSRSSAEGDLAQITGWATVGELELPHVPGHADGAALAAALDEGGTAPPAGRDRRDGDRRAAGPRRPGRPRVRGAHRVLALVQQWLADERLSESRLVVLTRARDSRSPKASSPTWRAPRCGASCARPVRAPRPHPARGSRRGGRRARGARRGGRGRGGAAARAPRRAAPRAAARAGGAGRRRAGRAVVRPRLDRADHGRHRRPRRARRPPPRREHGARRLLLASRRGAAPRAPTSSSPRWPSSGARSRSPPATRPTASSSPSCSPRSPTSTR
jgi:acyl transferase domain-containing protein